MSVSIIFYHPFLVLPLTLSIRSECKKSCFVDPLTNLRDKTSTPKLDESAPPYLLEFWSPVPGRTTLRLRKRRFFYVGHGRRQDKLGRLYLPAKYLSTYGTYSFMRRYICICTILCAWLGSAK